MNTNNKESQELKWLKSIIHKMETSTYSLSEYGNEFYSNDKVDYEELKNFHFYNNGKPIQLFNTVCDVLLDSEPLMELLKQVIRKNYQEVEYANDDSVFVDTKGIVFLQHVLIDVMGFSMIEKYSVYANLVNPEANDYAHAAARVKETA